MLCPLRSAPGLSGMMDTSLRAMGGTSSQGPLVTSLHFLYSGERTQPGDPKVTARLQGPSPWSQEEESSQPQGGWKEGPRGGLLPTPTSPHPHPQPGGVLCPAYRWSVPVTFLLFVHENKLF